MLLRHLVHPADAAVQQLEHGVVELAEVVENGRVHVHRAAAAVVAPARAAAATAVITDPAAVADAAAAT